MPDVSKVAPARPSQRICNRTIRRKRAVFGAGCLDAFYAECSQVFDLKAVASDILRRSKSRLIEGIEAGRLMEVEYEEEG